MPHERVSPYGIVAARGISDPRAFAVVGMVEKQIRVNMRNFLPVTLISLIKSIDQWSLESRRLLLSTVLVLQYFHFSERRAYLK